MAVTGTTPSDLPPLAPADEYLVVLVNGDRFDRLLRKDDLLDEGVAALFGLAGSEAELLALSFHADKFTPSQIATWLAERRFTSPAGALVLRTLSVPLTESAAVGRRGRAGVEWSSEGGWPW